MYFIDTHSHLYSEQFNDDIHDVVQRALNNDIKRIYLPNIDSSSIKSMLSLKENYPQVFEVMAGLHPVDVKANYKEELQIVEEELKKGGYVAVGEIGIDLYWDKTFLQEQIYAFQKQVEWALQYNLPFVIHARESFDEIFEALRKFDGEPLKGIFHSFTGTLDQAKTALSFGDFKLGINGIVTFKNSNLGEVVRQIGLEHLVLETDAPYLAPVPFRGKRNESSYVLNIAEKISSIFNVPLETVAEITTKNAKHIFGE